MEVKSLMGRAKQAAYGAAKVAIGAAERAEDAASGAVGAAGRTAAGAAGRAVNKGSQLANQAAGAGFGLVSNTVNAAKDISDALVSKAEDAARSAAEQVVIDRSVWLLQLCREKVKEQVVDEEMPDLLAEGLKTVVDDLWTDVMVSLALFPYAGLQLWFFCTLFFFMDRTDEYQLTKFIIKFKAFSCTHDDDGCDVEGDRSGSGVALLRYWAFYLEMVAFMVHMLLIWIAFHSLTACRTNPQTLKVQQQAVADLSKALPEDLETNACWGCGRRLGSGGRLAKWIYYDIVIFALSLVIIVILLAGEGLSLNGSDRDAEQ
eukprot:gene4362-5368_t